LTSSNRLARCGRAKGPPPGPAADCPWVCWRIRYYPRMPARRPPRSVGTTVLSDRLRAPSRQFPPDPAESVRDIRAVGQGETRRVVCYARQPDAWLHPAWPGSLLISSSSVVWRPGAGGRPRVRNLAGASVTLVRQTRPADGGPRKPHVFSLVRCAMPAGRLDLIVPTADVPLVAHCLGAGDLADVQSLLSPAGWQEPRPGSRIERRWRLVAAAGCLAAAAILIGTGDAGRYVFVPLDLGALFLASAIGRSLRLPRREPRSRRLRGSGDEPGPAG